MSDAKQPTHMLVPIGAFRAFDAIADLALRHGGIEAMRLVQQFTGQARPYTPPVVRGAQGAFDAAKRQQAAELVAVEAPENETGTEG